MAVGKKLSYYRKKADQALQSYYKSQPNFRCEGCNNPAVCMHHFFHKSIAASLRYSNDGLVKVCDVCHFAHHKKNDPVLHAVVLIARGQDWYYDLLSQKKVKVKISKGYYISITEAYNELTNWQKLEKERF